MPRFEITSPDGRRFEINAPDGATQEQIMQFAQRQFQSMQPSAENLDVPSSEQDAAVAQYYQQQQAIPSPTLAQQALGAGEALLAAGTGGTAGLIGQVAGALQQAGREISAGNFGSQDAANRIEQRAADVGASATYAPRTEQGQRILGAVGELTEPLAGLTPLTAEISAVGNAARAGLNNRLSAPRNATLNDAREFKEGSTDSRFAGKMVDPKTQSSLVNDPVANSVMKNGFDPRFVQALKQLNPADKSKIQKMVDTVDSGERDFYASKYSRASDILGESLADRVSYVKEINRRAGGDVEKAVKTLPEVVDPDVPFANFSSRLNDIGVRFDDNGSPLFRRSEVQGFPTDEKILRQVSGRIREVKSAKDLHNLKKYIYANVHFGKRKDGSIQPKTEIILKDFARDINAVLGEASPDYRNSNQVYSETVETLGDLQKAAGSVDILGDGSDKALGSRLRALLSNQQRRVDLQNSVESIDQVSKKYGAPFEDDIIKQAAIVDELEKFYGAPAKTSLGGELDKQAGQLIDKGITRTAIDKGLSLLSKSEQKKRQESLKALRELLQREE